MRRFSEMAHARSHRGGLALALALGRAAGLMAALALIPRAAGAQPSLVLEWSSTTGTGVPGGSSIEAAPGDQLSLDIVVQIDDSGFSSAFFNLGWDGSRTDPSFGEVCPSPPNPASGQCLSASGLTFIALVPVQTGPDTATSFGVIGIVPEFAPSTMVIARMNFTAEHSDTVSVFYGAGDGVAAGFGETFFPAASAEIVVDEECAVADSTFDPDDWTTTPLFQIGCTLPAIAEQVATGGNSGAYREMTHYPCTGQLRIFHEYTACWFDPFTLSPGESLEIDRYVEDRRVVSAPSPSAAMNASPAIVQDGVVYTLNANFAFTSTTWTRLQAFSLTESDFVQWNGSAQPDFSDTGGIIRFGYIRFGGNTFEDPVVHGIDNWSVTTNHPVTVPEPAGGLTMVIGCCFVWMLSRHHDRRRRFSPSA